VILDTNAVSALFAGEPRLERVLTGSDRHHLPVIVLGEYRYGLSGSRLREELGRQLETLERESVVLGTDRNTACHYAEVRQELKQQGTPIPENDVWLAALARQHNLPMVSHDRHFDHVRGLRRVDW